VGCGYLLDQFFAPRVASVLFSSVAIGIAFLEVGHAIWSAFIAAIGAEVDIIAYLTSRYFGPRSMERFAGGYGPSLARLEGWGLTGWASVSIRQVPMLCHEADFSAPRSWRRY
jgi:hypothetical protein